MTLTTQYDRPVTATLHVHLDNGESWPATDDDLVRFRLVTTNEAYMRFRRALADTLERHGLLPDDLTDTELNPLRHLAEIAIVHPELLGHTDHDSWDEVADIERTLIEAEQARQVAKGAALVPPGASSN